MRTIPTRGAQAHPATCQPKLALLGPVDWTRPPEGPLPEQRRMGRLTELAAYLATTPHPSPAGIDQALWPTSANPATRYAALSRLRRWLGCGPDGTPWLSPNTLQWRGATDVAQFYALTGTTNPRQKPSIDPDRLKQLPIEHLHSALLLVRGRPFDGVPAKRYEWADRLRVELTLDIAAVADAVATGSDPAWQLRAQAIRNELLPQE